MIKQVRVGQVIEFGDNFCFTMMRDGVSEMKMYYPLRSTTTRATVAGVGRIVEGSTLTVMCRFHQSGLKRQSPIHIPLELFASGKVKLVKDAPEGAIIFDLGRKGSRHP